LVVAVVQKLLWSKYFVVDECNTSRSVLRRKTTGPTSKRSLPWGLGPTPPDDGRVPIPKTMTFKLARTIGAQNRKNFLSNYIRTKLISVIVTGQLLSVALFSLVAFAPLFVLLNSNGLIVRDWG
jgi:hypothetical protein